MAYHMNHIDGIRETSLEVMRYEANYIIYHMPYSNVYSTHQNVMSRVSRAFRTMVLFRKTPLKNC